MENQTTNSNVNPSMPSPMAPMTPMKPSQKSSAGSIAATIIIIILIVIGALYFWGKRVETQRANQAAYDSANGISSQTASATEAAQIENVSSNDSITTLQSENQNTNTTNLSQGL